MKPVALVDNDIWGWWRLAQADPDKIGTAPLLIFPYQPQCGYYRVRHKKGDWQPVALYPDEISGDLIASRNGAMVTGDSRIEELWLWACRQPTSYEIFADAEAGKGYPDEPEKPRGIGDNIREADPFDALGIEYLGEKEQAEEFLKSPITTQAEADRAAIWADRLRDIANRADALHTAEKGPVLAEGKRIDDKYREIRTVPATLSKRLKLHQKDFLDEQDRKERERVAAAKREADRLKAEALAAARKAEQDQRRAEEEARRKLAAAERAQNHDEREKAQREAEAIQRQAERAVADAGTKIAEAKAAERLTEYQNPSAGRTGSKTKLVTYTSAVIEDWGLFLSAVKDRDEIKDVLQQIAGKAARAGIELPGMRIVKERRPG